MEYVSDHTNELLNNSSQISNIPLQRKGDNGMEPTGRERASRPQPQMLSLGREDARRVLEAYVTRSLSFCDERAGARRLGPRPHKWVPLEDKRRRVRRHSSDSSAHLPPDELEAMIAGFKPAGPAEGPATDGPLGDFEASSEQDYQTDGPTEGPEVSHLVAPSDQDAPAEEPAMEGPEASHSPASSEQEAPTDGPTERPAVSRLEASSEQEAPTDGPTERPAVPRLEASSEQEASTDGPTERPVVSRFAASLRRKQDNKPPKKGAKKTKKPSIFKSFLNLFSRRGSDKEETRTSSSPERGGAITPPDTPSLSLSCLPGHGPSSGADHASPPRRRSLRKKLSRKRFSFRGRGTDQPRGSLRSSRAPPGDLPDDNSADPASIYYVKVSEELEKIVKEVKDDHQIHDQENEIMEKIIDALKVQGDAIDKELKLDEGGLGAFVNSLSYRGFQELADLYVESGTPSQLPQGPPTAPELVKFAFSLDFTAKVAGLSSQTIGRIMGFGNQYLQDRFTQMSVSQGPESQSRQAQTFCGPD